jgi:hypothetical protein
VQNKSEVITESQGSGVLFATLKSDIATSVHLLPEHKKVDFILKIDNLENDVDLDEVIRKISEIEWVSMAYRIDKKQLKSKHNLIF